MTSAPRRAVRLSPSEGFPAAGQAQAAVYPPSPSFSVRSPLLIRVANLIVNMYMETQTDNDVPNTFWIFRNCP
jgi:hypothetical protein